MFVTPKIPLWSAPSAGWGHHPLIAKKVSGVKLVKGGVCRLFTLDKVGNANYSPRADDVETKSTSPYPNQQYMRTKKGGSWLRNRLSLSARFSN